MQLYFLAIKSIHRERAFFLMKNISPLGPLLATYKGSGLLWTAFLVANNIEAVLNFLKVGKYNAYKLSRGVIERRAISILE